MLIRPAPVGVQITQAETAILPKSSIRWNYRPTEAFGFGRGSSKAPWVICSTQPSRNFVATLVQRQGWGLVRKEQKPDRERARAIKSRQRAIGRELRRVYDNVAQEPVPDEFLDLLRKIDSQDPEGGTS
jgi:hypothetical protein